MVEVRHGRVRAQMLHVEIVLGMQVAHSGPAAPRWVTRRRRPQPTQFSRLIGSSTRQNGHNGRR
jgi:hypothetical protein